MHRIEPRERGASKTLLAEVAEQDADHLVMGGYGHFRLREWVLRGSRPIWCGSLRWRWWLPTEAVEMRGAARPS